MFDISAIRSQFPILNNAASPLVYLDSAATSQKPEYVINALTRYYREQNANVHRGNHQLTATATTEFERARGVVAQFINSPSSENIIWTRGSTEAINLIAHSYGALSLQPHDIILVGEAEHHANIVPWQLIAEQTQAIVKKIPVDSNGELIWSEYVDLLSDKVKIVALAHVTNVTGCRQPIEDAIEFAHRFGAAVVVDGAQGVVHEEVDVVKLNADFYLFSGHKLFSPTGIGALYGKANLLEAMSPWQGGGKMVESVSFEETHFAQAPSKFEAGTPNIAGAIALASAIEWYQQWPIDQIEQHIIKLQQYAYQKLIELEGVKVIGYQKSASLLSFVVEDIHHQDIATLLDQQGVAIRSGHHCAHPLMKALGLNGTVRVSFAIYNTQEDVELFIQALEKTLSLL
ncbi:aminotransferase class V-fold PLP-dependent enzyme [Vibrio sp. RC27]